MRTVSKLTPYSQLYKDSCFQAWYAAGRPTTAQIILDAIPEDDYGRKPELETIRHWRNEDKWDSHADELDFKVRAGAEATLVETKVKMLIEQAERGQKLQVQGMEYLDAEGFDSSSSAVQAIIKGAQLERESRGLSTAILKLAQLTDEDLLSETQKMLERMLDSGEIIDVAEVPEETENAEVED